MGATVGPSGTRLAQAHLRHVLGVAGVAVFPRPLLVAAAARHWLPGGGDASGAWDTELQAGLGAWLVSLAAAWQPPADGRGDQRM